MTAENTGRLRAPDDSRRAARYLRVAVAAGDADAMNALGSMLLRGDEKATGEPRDFQAAARLFAEAGARGCAAADYNLAACLEAGAGVEKDAGKAKSLFRRALSLGVFRAHLPLGYLALHHDEDLGAAARHFSAVSGDVPGDVSAKRLETLGIGEGDVAEATFCLADVSERAADVGLARLERLRASGAVAETLERRLEALRDDGGAFESQKREGENATDDALDLSVHRDAEETAARRDATLRAVAASSAEQDANAAGDLVRHVATARDRARAHASRRRPRRWARRVPRRRVAVAPDRRARVPGRNLRGARGGGDVGGARSRKRVRRRVRLARRCRDARRVSPGRRFRR
jgi:TPR repeat protein